MTDRWDLRELRRIPVARPEEDEAYALLQEVTRLRLHVEGLEEDRWLARACITALCAALVVAIGMLAVGR
jgi:hypothetical protein